MYQTDMSFLWFAFTMTVTIVSSVIQGICCLPPVCKRNHSVLTCKDVHSLNSKHLSDDIFFNIDVQFIILESEKSLCTCKTTNLMEHLKDTDVVVLTPSLCPWSKLQYCVDHVQLESPLVTAGLVISKNDSKFQWAIKHHLVTLWREVVRVRDIQVRDRIFAGIVEDLRKSVEVTRNESGQMSKSLIGISADKTEKPRATTSKPPEFVKMVDEDLALIKQLSVEEDTDRNIDGQGIQIKDPEFQTDAELEENLDRDLREIQSDLTEKETQKKSKRAATNYFNIHGSNNILDTLCGRGKLACGGNAKGKELRRIRAVQERKKSVKTLYPFPYKVYTGGEFVDLYDKFAVQTAALRDIADEFGKAVSQYEKSRDEKKTDAYSKTAKTATQKSNSQRKNKFMIKNRRKDDNDDDDVVDNGDDDDDGEDDSDEKSKRTIENKMKSKSRSQMFGVATEDQTKGDAVNKHQHNDPPRHHQDKRENRDSEDDDFDDDNDDDDNADYDELDEDEFDSKNNTNSTFVGDKKKPVVVSTREYDHRLRSFIVFIIGIAGIVVIMIVLLIVACKWNGMPPAPKKRKDRDERLRRMKEEEEKLDKSRKIFADYETDHELKLSEVVGNVRKPINDDNDSLSTDASTESVPPDRSKPEEHERQPSERRSWVKVRTAMDNSSERLHSNAKRMRKNRSPEILASESDLLSGPSSYSKSNLGGRHIIVDFAKRKNRGRSSFEDIALSLVRQAEQRNHESKVSKGHGKSKSSAIKTERPKEAKKNFASLNIKDNSNNKDEDYSNNKDVNLNQTGMVSFLDSIDRQNGGVIRFDHRSGYSWT